MRVENSIFLKQDSFYIYQNRANLTLQNTNTMSRIPVLTQMLETEPTDAFLLFALAKEYETIGDTSSAHIYYTSCAEHNPDYVGLYYHLGKHYEKKNDLTQAIAIYKKGMEIAKTANDRHAFSELQQAFWEISDED